ncbi:YcxB family protein [Burkholderia sp. F1]|uniref:YcxB family protein n=1 Tax=Burkholderia sp. F1 TaxID=3366817 RepID=UPI003D706C31
MSDIVITFQPAVEDLLLASRLNLRRKYTGKYLLKTFAIVSVTYAILLPGIFWMVGGTLPRLHDAWWALGIAALVTISSPLVGSLLLPRAVRKVYSQQKSLHQPHTVTARSDGFVVETPTSRDEIRYADLLQWSEDRDTILYYQSVAMLRFIPKRLLTESQAASLRQTLDRNGVRKV